MIDNKMMNIFKNIKTWFSLLVILFVFFTVSCQRVSLARSDMFGNNEESKKKKKIESSYVVELQSAFRQIYELYKASMVFITTEQMVRVRNPFFADPWMMEYYGYSRLEKRTGLGTGFILTSDGYICTNFHVVDGVDKIFVKIEDDEYQAQVIGLDKITDLALLKINTDKILKPVYLGDSDKVNVGDWSIAIGNPFGLDKTFTVGVISAIGRSDVDLLGTSHFQTDASINPGNSGGPLINISGEVIGINRMIYSKSGGHMGIGFAIPINSARTVLGELQKNGEVRRGYLGLSTIKLTEKNASELGIKTSTGYLINELMPDAPAAKGGLKVGDVILEVNGSPIKSNREFQIIINNSKIGQKIIQALHFLDSVERRKLCSLEH
jgi:S1-C subfamily serine protease